MADRNTTRVRSKSDGNETNRPKGQAFPAQNFRTRRARTSRARSQPWSEGGPSREGKRIRAVQHGREIAARPTPTIKSFSGFHFFVNRRESLGQAGQSGRPATIRRRIAHVEETPRRADSARLRDARSPEESGEQLHFMLVPVRRHTEGGSPPQYRGVT